MRKKIKIILMFAICMGLILLNTNVNAKTAKAINNVTRVRKEASTSSDIVELASQGDSVEIISEEGDWYKVKYAGKTGYIRKDMLEVAESETSNQQENVVSENTTTENSVSENKTTENSISENKTAENNNQESNQTDSNTTVENKQTTSSDKNNDSLKVGDKGRITGAIEIKIIPTITSSVIATIYENTEISVKDIINKWCYIETDNSSGWVLVSKVKNMQTSEVEETETTEAQNNEEENKKDEQEEKTEKEEEQKQVTKTKTKYVSTETLNVREKAQNDAKVIKQLTINTAVIVSEEVDGTWSKVTAKGVTGYVASKYLSDEKVEITSRSEEQTRSVDTSSSENIEKESDEQKKSTESANSGEEKEEKSTSGNSSNKSSSSEGTDIVNYATQFIGNPYVYGGTSLTNGCDCSGFVMSVYSHFGYSLPRSSGSMRSVGVAVSESDLEPGDILCFSGHVGIYIGNNTFVHAANEQKGIITTSLSSSYYQRNYICARRVI